MAYYHSENADTNNSSRYENKEELEKSLSNKGIFKKEISSSYTNSEMNEQIMAEIAKNNQELEQEKRKKGVFKKETDTEAEQEEYRQFKQRMKQKEVEDKLARQKKEQQELQEKRERQEREKRELQEIERMVKENNDNDLTSKWDMSHVEDMMGMFHSYSYDENKPAQRRRFGYNNRGSMSIDEFYKLNNKPYLSFEEAQRKKAEDIRKEKELLKILMEKNKKGVFNKVSNQYEIIAPSLRNPKGELIKEIKGQEVTSSPSVMTEKPPIEQIEKIPSLLPTTEELNQDSTEKLSLFKRMGQYVQSYWKKEDIQLSPEEQALKDKIDRLINNLILPEVYRLAKNGIELSQEQKDKFDHQLSKLIHEGQSEQLKEMLAEGYTPRKELLAHWLAYYAEKEEIKELFNHELKQVWTNKEVIDLILALRIQKLKELITITTQRRIVERPHEYSRIIEQQKGEQHKLRQTINQEMEKLLNLYTSMKKSLDIDLYTHILDLFSELNEKENVLHTLYKATRRPLPPTRPGSLNSNAIESPEEMLERQSKNIEETMRSQINHFYKTINEKTNKPFKIELSNYPQEIQEQLVVLETKIDECKKEQGNMTEHEWERLEGLWTNVLNKSLIAYVEMSDKHKKELLSVESKTPQQLLSETITHIDELIERKLLEINEQRLHSLSVTQRYAQTIKKNF